MPRHCKQCGRPLDREHHDIGGNEKGKRPIPDRKHGIRWVTAWLCRVRRLADQTAPILHDARDGAPIDTGKRKVLTSYVPDVSANQRTRENNLRFVPTAILEARSR